MLLFAARGDQLADDQVLALEALLPAPQALHLLGAEALKRVQGSVEVLGQHLAVEAVAGEAAAGVAAGKVLVGAAGAVEVAARGDIEDTTAHGEVDGVAVEPIVGQQGARRVCLEDGGGGLARQLGRLARLEEQVGGVGRQEDEERVEGGREAGAGVVRC